MGLLYFKWINFKSLQYKQGKHNKKIEYAQLSIILGCGTSQKHCQNKSQKSELE